jgi:hypothetical protein
VRSRRSGGRDADQFRETAEEAEERIAREGQARAAEFDRRARSIARAQDPMASLADVMGEGLANAAREREYNPMGKYTLRRR